MAEIVLGIGTSHSPQVSTGWEQWPNMRRIAERSPTAPTDIEAQLEPAMLESRFDSVQKAVKTLSSVLKLTPLDAIVMFGDDQHEQFDDQNMPAIAIYHGDRVPVAEPRRATIPWTGAADQRHLIATLAQPTLEAYPSATDLAGHLVTSLTEARV